MTPAGQKIPQWSRKSSVQMVFENNIMTVFVQPADVHAVLSRQALVALRVLSTILQ